MQPSIVTMSNVAAVFTANVEKLLNTVCSQKQKISCFQHISDCILSSGLVSNANYFKHCSTATNVLLLFCEDLDSVVRMSAEENLCKIFRCLEKTRVCRILMDLLNEIKRNGNQKSLRICLNMFGYYSPQIKERNLNWYALRLLPCMQNIAKRKETALQECFSDFVKSFGKNLQMGLTDRETCKLLEVFLDNLGTDCVVKRRCSAQNCITLIENSRNKNHMATFVLKKSIELLLINHETNTILGVLGLFRTLLPVVIRGFANDYHDDDEVEPRLSYSKHRKPMFGNKEKLTSLEKESLPLIIRNECKQIIEIYDFCLHLLSSSNTSNHSLINASLEVVSSILQAINDAILCASQHPTNKLNSNARILKEFLVNQQLKHNEYLQHRKSLKNQIFQLQNKEVLSMTTTLVPSGLLGSETSNVSPSHIKIMSNKGNFTDTKNSNSNSNANTLHIGSGSRSGYGYSDANGDGNGNGNSKGNGNEDGDGSEKYGDDFSEFNKRNNNPKEKTSFICVEAQRAIANTASGDHSTLNKYQNEREQMMRHDETSMKTPSSPAHSSPWSAMGINSMAGSSTFSTNDSLDCNILRIVTTDEDDDNIADKDDDEEVLRVLKQKRKEEKQLIRNSARSISECMVDDEVDDEIDDEVDDDIVGGIVNETGGDDVLDMVEMHAEISITNINKVGIGNDEEEEDDFTTFSEINEPRKPFALTGKVDVDNLIDAIGTHTSDINIKTSTTKTFETDKTNNEASLSNTRYLEENIPENLLAIDSMTPVTTLPKTIVAEKDFLTDDKSQQLSDLDNESFKSIEFESEITIENHRGNTQSKEFNSTLDRMDKGSELSEKNATNPQDAIGSFFNAASESMSKLFKTSSATVKPTSNKSLDSMDGARSSPTVSNISSNSLNLGTTTASILSSSDGLKDETLSITHSLTPSTAVLADAVNRNVSLDKTSCEDLETLSSNQEPTIFWAPNVNPFLKDSVPSVGPEECSPEKLAPFIGTVNEQTMILYTARLIAVRFLLTGKVKGLLPDATIRVSIKNVALNVISQCIRLLPSALQMSLAITIEEKEQFEYILRKEEGTINVSSESSPERQSQTSSKSSFLEESVDKASDLKAKNENPEDLCNDMLQLEIKDDHFGKSTCEFLLESPLTHSAGTFFLQKTLDGKKKAEKMSSSLNKEIFSKTEYVETDLGNKLKEDLPPRPPKRNKSIRKQNSQIGIKKEFSECSNAAKVLDPKTSTKISPKLFNQKTVPEQSMADILLYCNHSDPILRGGVQQIIGNFVESSGAGLAMQLHINLQHLLAILIKGLQDEIHTVVIQALNAFDKIFPHVLSKYMTIQTCHYQQQTWKVKNEQKEETKDENREKSDMTSLHRNEHSSETQGSAKSCSHQSISSKGSKTYLCSMERTFKLTCPRTIFKDNDEVIVALLDAFNSTPCKAVAANNKSKNLFKAGNDPGASAFNPANSFGFSSHQPFESRKEMLFEKKDEENIENVLISPKLLLNKLRLCHYNKYWLVQNKYAEVISNLNYVNLYCYYQQKKLYTPMMFECYFDDDDNNIDNNDIVSTYQNQFLNELMQQLEDEDIRVREHVTECIVRFIIINAKEQKFLEKLQNNESKLKAASNIEVKRGNIQSNLGDENSMNFRQNLISHDRNSVELDSLKEMHQTNFNLLWDFFDYRLFSGMSVPLRNLCKIDSAITPTFAEILSPGSAATIFSSCNTSNSSSTVNSSGTSSLEQNLFETMSPKLDNINILCISPRQMDEEEKLLAKVLYRMTNKLMVLNDKNIQVGIIYALKVLLKYFNFFDFQRTWTEFNLLDICQKFSTFNTSLALDLNCQIDLIQIITQLTTGANILATNEYTVENNVENLFLHNMKILNIYYQLFKNEKFPSLGKTQRTSAAANEKEFIGYFAHDNIYLSLYNVLKNSFNSYKITITHDCGILLISLLKTCLHSLSLCIEMSKWSSGGMKRSVNKAGNTLGPSNNVLKLIEEILIYLTKLIIYAPVECIACLRQLCKYLFAQNYGNQLRMQHRHMQKPKLEKASLPLFIRTYFANKCFNSTIRHVDSKRSPIYLKQTMVTRSPRTESVTLLTPNNTMIVANENPKRNTTSQQGQKRTAKTIETVVDKSGDYSGSSYYLNLGISSVRNIQSLHHQLGEVFEIGFDVNELESEFEDECARHIKIFEPLVIFCLTLFMKSNAIVQASILGLLSQLLDLNVTYSNLDSKNVIFDQIMNNLELIESGIARNGHIIIPPIIKFLIQLTHKSDRKLITIPKIISITNNLLANNGIRQYSILALKALAYEIFFIQQPHGESAINKSMSANTSATPTDDMTTGMTLNTTLTSNTNVDSVIGIRTTTTPSPTSLSSSSTTTTITMGTGTGTREVPIKTAERGAFQSPVNSLPTSQGYIADIQNVNAKTEALLANCRELETQKEVVLGMLEKFIDSNECQRVLSLLLLRERCFQQFQVDDLEIVGIVNQEDKTTKTSSSSSRTINNNTTNNNRGNHSRNSNSNSNSNNNGNTNTTIGIKSPLRMQLQDPDVVFSIVCRCMSEGRLYIDDWNNFCELNSFFQNNDKHVLADSKQFLILLQLFIEKDVGNFNDLSYATIILANVILKTEEIYLVNHIKLYLKNNPMAEQKFLDEIGEEIEEECWQTEKQSQSKELFEYYDDKPSTSWAAAQASNGLAIATSGSASASASASVSDPLPNVISVGKKRKTRSINEINFFAKVLYFKLEACFLTLTGTISNQLQENQKQQEFNEEGQRRQQEQQESKQQKQRQYQQQIEDNSLYLKVVVRFVKALNHVCCCSRHKDALQSVFRLVLAESEFLDKYYNFLMKSRESTLVSGSPTGEGVFAIGSNRGEQHESVEELQVEVFKFLSAMKLVEPLVFLLQQIETVGIKWVVQRTLLSEVCLSNLYGENHQLQQLAPFCNEKILKFLIVDHGGLICKLSEKYEGFSSLFQDALLENAKILNKQTICSLLNIIVRIAKEKKHEIESTGKFLQILGILNETRGFDKALQIQIKRLAGHLVSATMASGNDKNKLYDYCSKENQSKDPERRIENPLRIFLSPDPNNAKEKLGANSISSGSTATCLESRIIDEKWLFTKLIKFSTQPDYNPKYLCKILLEIKSESKLYKILSTPSFAVERILRHVIVGSLEAMLTTFRYNCIQNNPHIYYMQVNPLVKVSCSILMSRIEATLSKFRKSVLKQWQHVQQDGNIVEPPDAKMKSVEKNETLLRNETSGYEFYLVEAVIGLISSIKQIELTGLVYIEAKFVDKFIREQLLCPKYIGILLGFLEWCCKNIIAALDNISHGRSTSLHFNENEASRAFERDAKDSASTNVFDDSSNMVEGDEQEGDTVLGTEAMSTNNICLLLRCINTLLQQKYIWSALNQTENHNTVNNNINNNTNSNSNSYNNINSNNTNTNSNSSSGTLTSSENTLKEGNTNVFYFKHSSKLLCLVLDVLILVTRKSIQNTVFYKSYSNQFDTITALAVNNESVISMENTACSYGHGHSRFNTDGKLFSKTVQIKEDKRNRRATDAVTKTCDDGEDDAYAYGIVDCDGDGDGDDGIQQADAVRHSCGLVDNVSNHVSRAKILQAYASKAIFIAKLIETKIEMDCLAKRSDNEHTLSMTYVKGTSSSKSLGNLIKNFNASSATTSTSSRTNSILHDFDLNETDDLNYQYEQMNLIVSIGIALLRTNLLYAYAVTPYEILEKEQRLQNLKNNSPFSSPNKTDSQFSSLFTDGKLPTLSVESLSDNEILKKFIKRLSIFGFTTRQQFEEYFMTFLLLINRIYDENMVDQQEQFQIKNVCLEAILELLITYKTFPIVGNKVSYFHHTPRWSRLNCENISLKKLHQVQMLISKQNVFYHSNLERDLLKDNVIGTNYFGCNQYNLDFIWQQMEAYVQPMTTPDKEDSSSSYARKTSSDEISVRNFKFFTLQSGIDFKSSSQLVFDVLLQLLEENHILVLPNLVKFCEICESRDQIKQIKEKVFKLQEIIPMDDTISHQHLIYLMCKTEAMLIPTHSELVQLCTLIDNYLRSSHVFIRNATLNGLLCLLECCSRTNTTIGKLNEELTLIRNLIVRYINAHGIIDESPLQYSDSHTILVWTLNFALIEWTSKFVPRCELFTNTIVAANKLLRETTNEKVILCIIHGLERIIVINSCGKVKTNMNTSSIAAAAGSTSSGTGSGTGIGNNDASDSCGIVTSNLRQNIKKLALDLVKSGNENLSIPALKLLMTCMYVESTNQLENTELLHGVVQDDPEIIATQIDKVDLLLHCIKSSSRDAAWIYGHVLCQIIRDLVPPNEILTKVIKEFLAINQPYCDVIAMVVHQVFRSAIDASFLPKLQDWLIYSLPTFLQLETNESIWRLCVIFLSASINIHLIKLFPVVLCAKEFRKLGQNEIALFETATQDFYGKLSTHQKIVFRDAFEKFKNNEIFAQLLQTL